jgi:sulfoquinovose isomerase
MMPRTMPTDDWLEAEGDRLLAFARGARVEGGFGWLDDRGRPDPERPLQLWITARMTHVFALAQLLGRPDCEAFCDHGVHALRGAFEDREHGGWYAEVKDGGPARTDKTAYEHAFVLLAGAGAAAAGRPGGAELCRDAAAVVAERFWVEQEGACRESWDRAWREPEPYRGANANMHLVEACLAAGDALGDATWHRRALSIAERLIDRSARAHAWRVPEHYDGDWNPLPGYNQDQPRHPFRPYGVTPGHGLEWARLLAHIDASPATAPWLLGAARGLFERALADGWHDGFAYTTDLSGEPVVRDRFHWVLAEAICTAATLGETAHEERFWDFAERHFIDREHGSWHHELDPQNRPAGHTWQGKPDVYHAYQATLVPRLPLAPSLAAAARQRAG